MKGISLFSSVVSSDMEMAMRDLGVKNVDISFYFTGSNPFIDDLFGIKYIHSFWENDEIARHNEKIYDENNVVYLNNNALPVGYAVSRDINNVDISKSGNAAYNQNLFVNNAVGADDIFEIKHCVSDVYSPQFEVEWNEEESSISVIQATSTELPEMISLCVNYDIDEEGEYYFNCDFHYIYIVSVYVNQNMISENENANQLLCLGNLDKGDSLTVEVQVPLAYLSRNLPVYLSKYDSDQEEIAISEIAKHALNVDSCSGNTLTGNVVVEDNEMLFLSIPYDKGWTAYVDGKKTDIIKVYGAFSGIEMDAGTHKVELKYVSEGFTLGLITTVISWVVFLLIVIICFKKKRKAVEA